MANPQPNADLHTTPKPTPIRTHATHGKPKQNPQQTHSPTPISTPHPNIDLYAKPQTPISTPPH